MNKVLENEQEFNRVNTMLAERTGSLVPSDFPKEFVINIYCECVNKACREKIEIAYEEYVKLAKDPLTFVIKPEHLLPEFERVVKKEVNYWTIIKRVEKLGKQFEL